MSLYIRVFTSFFTHRKTARLRSIIGDAALWLPPRLWAYAAENQPDGVFKDYEAKEIASLIGYIGNASRMLQAMLQAGFMERNPLRIHDWQDYNSYHKTFSERAAKGAAARWAKGPSPIPPPEKGKERKGKERSQALLDDAPSIASSIAQASATDSKRAGLEDVRLFCAKSGISENDADWFFHKCEGCGWTNGGKPIKRWQSTLTAWKVAGYLPSQKNAKPSQQPDKKTGYPEDFFHGTEHATDGSAPP